MKKYIKHKAAGAREFAFKRWYCFKAWLVYFTIMLWWLNALNTLVYNATIETSEFLSILFTIGAYALFYSFVVKRIRWRLSQLKIFKILFWVFKKLESLAYWIIDRVMWKLYLRGRQSDFFQRYKIFFRTSKYIVLAIFINVFNLAMPWYNFVADHWMLAVAPVLRISDNWNQHENQLVKNARQTYPRSIREIIRPAWLPEHTNGNDTNFRIAEYSLVINTANKWYGVPEHVLPSLLYGETKARMAQLPKSVDLVGGTEAGAFQKQTAFSVVNNITISGRLKQFMDKNGVYNVYMEYQRTRLLAMLCGFELPFFPDLFRYYAVSSIDDRLGLESFFHTARILKQYRNKAARQFSGKLEAYYWELSIRKWHAGGFSNKKNRVKTSYIKPGKAYVVWAKSQKQILITKR